MAIKYVGDMQFTVFNKQLIDEVVRLQKDKRIANIDLK